MATDPICGMNVGETTKFQLSHNGRKYYFCSGGCIKKFVSENDIPEENINVSTGSPKWTFYRNKTFIVSVILVLLIMASYVLPVLSAFRHSLFDYIKMIWWAILLGLVLGGLIDNYIPREYISHLLAKPKKRTVFYSVILGFFMSACSHGILAISIQLHKKGASPASVVSFLLASPWANITLTFMLIGFFGLKALFILLSAIIIAIVTGLIFQLLESKKLIEENPNVTVVDEGFSIVSDLKKRMRNYKLTKDTLKTDCRGIFQGIVALSNMVLWWMLIGIGLASAAGAYVPSDFFTKYMGANFLGLFVTLAFATVIEVCSEGSAPMAFELFRQTAALGNSFVFLMAGVVTDYTEIGLIWQNIGKKTAIWLPVVAIPQVLLLGYSANLVF
jgi:uncharacterized membrane protein YraQ (UPF0718 family)/YHS domain-containing protein